MRPKPKLRIYYLEVKDAPSQLDYVFETIVQAATPAAARKLAADAASDEGPAIWSDKERVSIKVLGIARRGAKPKVLMQNSLGF